MNNFTTNWVLFRVQ